MSQSIAEHVKLVRSIGSQPPVDTQDVIVRSWIRCLNEYGLDPARKSKPFLIEAGQLQERIDRLSPVVANAKLEMTNLYQQLADTRLLVLLTDADGVVLNIVGDPQFTRDVAINGLREGSVWSERQQGTNGMGTCLIEGGPVIIHRGEHFLASNIDLTCTAAPIFDSTGKLVAVLDVSSRSPILQQHSMVLVKMSAQMIENRTLLARHRDDFVIRFHSRPEFVDTLNEGILAFSADGRAVAVNRSAVFQLGFANCSEILGCDVESMLNASLADLVSRSASSSFHPVAVYGTKQGSRFFAVAQEPERMARQVRTGRDRGLIGASDAARQRALAELEFGDAHMAENIRCVSRVLDRDIAILLRGETGSGKDVFAKAIHAASKRASAPFVAVNCASLPEALIESELFGYRSGAFTGANRDGRRGKICQANGGTLFLDEIGDMPLALQARLLRVLEEREVVPLGGEASIRVDVQLISATHRDLSQMVKRGEFREDLYYRLQGVTLTLPPLRERADKAKLILHTLEREAEAGTARRIENSAMAMLETFPWPGNLRQLRNVLRAAIAMCDGSVIRVQDLPEEIRSVGVQIVASAINATAESPLNPLESAEREALLRELQQHHWNISNLAQQLKTSRNTVYRKMKRLGIHGEPEARGRGARTRCGSGSGMTPS